MSRKAKESIKTALAMTLAMAMKSFDVIGLAEQQLAESMAYYHFLESDADARVRELETKLRR